MLNLEENLTVVRWNDNKIVNLLSSFVGTEPVGVCSRFDKKLRRRVDVPCPLIIEIYNNFMGGVDLCDMFLALFRIDRRSKKYYLRIVYYLFSVCCCNAWIIHKINAKILRAKVFPLREFIKSLSMSLMRSGKPRNPINNNRTASESLDTDDTSTRNYVYNSNKVSSDIRHDNVDHVPSFFPVNHSKKDTRQRCKVCGKKTNAECLKCNTPLCILLNRNCFSSFHKK